MELGLGLSELLVLPLYFAAILAIVLTLSYRIEIGIFFLIPFLSQQNILNYINQLPLGKDINDILFIAIIIKWVIDKVKAKESLLVQTPLNVPIFFFLGWTFLAVWWGDLYFENAVQLSWINPRVIYWKNLIRIPLLYLIVVNNIKNPDHKKLIVFLIIMSILMIDRGFYNIAQWRDYSHYTDDQKIGGLDQSLGGNELAVFLAMYVVVILSLFLHTPSVMLRVLLAIPISLTYYCILFLFSRSGYLAAVVGCAVIGLLKNRLVLIGILILIISWQSLLPVAVQERIEMTKTDEGYDGTIQQRIGMWEFGKEIISASPVLGAGINAAHFINITPEGFDGQVWHSFHNAYLQQAVETGLIGLGIYLWIFALMLVLAWRLYHTSRDWFDKTLGLGLLACVLTCLAGNIAGGYWNYLSVVGYMYVLAGMVMDSLLNLEKHQVTTPAKKEKINKAVEVSHT